jgi:hypothetical protein
MVALFAAVAAAAGPPLPVLHSRGESLTAAFGSSWAVLDLFGRYPQGDGAFGARLRVR